MIRVDGLGQTTFALDPTIEWRPPGSAGTVRDTSGRSTPVFKITPSPTSPTGDGFPWVFVAVGSLVVVGAVYAVTRLRRGRRAGSKP